MMEADNDVSRRHTQRDELAGDLAVGPILFKPDFAVFDANVQYHTLHAALPGPADADDQILVVLIVERAVRLNARSGRALAIQVRVTRQNVSDGRTIGIQLIHCTTSSAARSTT